MNYTDLKDSIASYLHRSDLTSMIPEFIADAEARIYNELRIKAMEASYSQAVSSGSVTLPTGFLEWINLYVDGDSAQKLTRKDPEWIYTNYPARNGAGKPVFFAREGESLIFGPYAGAYTINGRYYKRLTALSASNTTNWFTENEPALLRYGALCEAAPYMINDERIPIWEGKYQAAKARIQKTDRDESTSGSLIQMRQG